jgi:hypothetical protein
MRKIADVSAELCGTPSGKGDAVEPDGPVPGPGFWTPASAPASVDFPQPGRSDDGEAIAGL